jgi:hypothetical protein
VNRSSNRDAVWWKCAKSLARASRFWFSRGVNITRRQYDNNLATQIACTASCGQALRLNSNDLNNAALNNNSLNIGRVGV